MQLGRSADAGGSISWTSQLDAGLFRSSMLLSYSEGAERRTLTADLVGNGYFDTDNTYQASRCCTTAPLGAYRIPAG